MIRVLVADDHTLVRSGLEKLLAASGDIEVVGAAANEAARIEALCKTLDVDLLVSGLVARALPGQLRSLGGHTLRGVGDKMELFTLPER